MNAPLQSKVYAAILIIVFTIAAYAQNKDLRVVSGVTVDLTPIHDYEAEVKSGIERPLQHWKWIQIVEIMPGTTAWNKCRVTVEGERAREIFLDHIPTATMNAFLELSKTEKQKKELSDYIDKETKRVRMLQANAPDTAPSGTAAGNQIREANQAVADLKNKADDLHSLSERCDELKESWVKASKELAMFTGRKYVGLEIWDCGQKK